MRILIISEVFWPEDFMINEIAKEWLNMGHHVEVISQYPSYPQSYVYENYTNKGETIEEWWLKESSEPILIYRYEFVEGYKKSKKAKFSNYLKFIYGGNKIARKIGKNFDVVFVSQTGPLTVAFPALAARKKWGVPVAILTLDIWPDVVWTYGVPKMKMIEIGLNRLIKHIYSHCDKIFISSRRFASSIGKYVDKECVYAPNWLRRVDEKKSSLRLEEGFFHFTFTGNISRYQNLKNTILGFKKFREKIFEEHRLINEFRERVKNKDSRESDSSSTPMPTNHSQPSISDVVLNLVGNGSYMDELANFVEHNGIENVEFRGRFPYNEMGDIMRQSDVLVLPLIDNEGIMKTEPLKLQSYLNAGKPILGILGGSGKDIIEEYNLGLCATPSDVDDIARKFHEIYEKTQDSAYVEGVAKRELDVMHTRFNKDEIMKALTQGLEDLVAQRKKYVTN